jgi:hypothetical protein
MQADEPGVKVIANNNYFANRNGQKPHYIILHGTAGGTSAEAIANYFVSTVGTNNPVSSHYVIGQDGEIVQCVAEKDGAWANGALTAGHASFWNESINPNLITISIEHCKPATDNSNNLTQAQKDASFRLIRDICRRCDIPAHDANAEGGITGHFSLDPVNRTDCPGSYPWNELWDFLQEEGDGMLNLDDPVVKRYFIDGGNGTWRCKNNGVILQDANLTFYRSKGGPALFGLPLSNEIYLSQYPNTAIVPCERVMLVFDPDRKIDHPPITGQCYLLHIDSGIGKQLLDGNKPNASPNFVTAIRQIIHRH